MNNKLILDLTVRLTQALDQNYDVVNMDTVLAVISALEGATITKEQLETTRLAKHINQLRRRKKNKILAIRAKNLLKKWREMVGITSQAQSEVVSSATQPAQPTQQQAPKSSLSSTSQPASPYTSQLLGENFDNSLSSIGGGVEFSRTATGNISNTGSANFTFNKKSATAGEGGGGGGGSISSRSNGALSDTQMRLLKSANRSITNNNSPSLPAATAATKVKHPTSFKNLITGFNVNNVPKQAHSSVLSPLLKALPSSGVDTTTTAAPTTGERMENNLKINSTKSSIDDDDNQSQPSTTGVTQSGRSSPRTHKPAKRKERDSPIVMAFMENTNSPLSFENVAGHSSQITTQNNNVNQIVTSTIDLHDSNSNSNFVNALCEETGMNAANNGEGRDGLSNNSNNKRLRKDKKQGSTDMTELFTLSGHFQPNIEESSRIAFPISGIQEYLSLSNSSMSLFPSQQTAGSGGTEGYPINAGSNDDNQLLVSLTERNNDGLIDGDLTFAGKFKQSNNSSGIEVGSSSTYFSNGGENMSATSGEFPCGNMKVAINNCRESVSVGECMATPSTFLPFSRNSSDSTSNSRNSQLDLIDVVNQDSQSMITVDDLRQQQQSSNDKIKLQRDVENLQDVQQLKYITKENSNAAKQYSKEPIKSITTQKPINTSTTSKPSTPTSVQNANVANAVSSPSVAEQKIPKKRGRKKGSKGVDSVLAQSAVLSSQFLMSPALGPNKKVKTTMELLADIQNRMLGSATSSPTLMNWFGTSRPASSCSEASLHSPRTSDACSTNATMSTVARSTPEKNISNNSVAADELYESDSDSNTSEPSHDSVKLPITSNLLKNSQLKGTTNEEGIDGTEESVPSSTIEEQIKDIMALLPPVDVKKIDWETNEDIPCTCTLREVPPDVDEVLSVEITENGLELLESIEDIKHNEAGARLDDDEPIISVSVVPVAVVKPPPHAKAWSPMAPHSQSAPVSAVTSPIVPPTNQKPMKSIFDLDFDDDNDPLHTFVEAASKTKNPSETHTATTENGRITTDEQHTAKLRNTQSNDHSEVVDTHQIQQAVTQSEPTRSPSSPTMQPVLQQLPPLQIASNDSTMPVYANFPTYEAVEDPDCPARHRYEIQTNQLTGFHINAFHNCFIPNVNGNWDHSMPQNLEDECHRLENDSLYANVVPKYGCFVIERIPKDLSHVRFTKNFKPKITKKSDKPAHLFLGVANIHRRQSFRLHHQRRLKKKAAFNKTKKLTKVHVKAENDQELKKDDIKLELPSVPNAIASSNIPEPNEALTIKIDDEKAKKSSPLSSVHPEELSPTENKKLHDKNDNLTKQECTIVHNNHVNNLITPPNNVLSPPSVPERNNGALDHHRTDSTEIKKPIANGNVHHLNNNSIVHCSDSEIKSDMSYLFIGTLDSDGIAASRRSSSCSNSSLRQNQKSINMKLRRHRLEQQQLEKQRQRRKRKHLISLTDVFEFDTDRASEQPKDPPLIKRIKLVNGEYASARRLTNSITDSSCLEDDGDSDCYHVHSENDIITEEEVDDDCDDHVIRDADEDEYDEIADDYDDDDGDDEEDVEEDYGDFHEVVTRDMTSSTTGNNHIVLTIKKTPSKTNSPSSSSMSPAPVVSVNAKLPLISPTIQSTVDALLSEDKVIELDANLTESGYEEDKHKLELEKLLELSTVKAVDLIGKTNFFLPESSDVSIYSFQLKKNCDNDHGNDNIDGDDNDGDDNAGNGGGGGGDNGPDEDPRPEEPIDNETDQCGNQEQQPEANTPLVDPKEFQEITKTQLSESLQLTKKHLRRLELKSRLRQGIEEAQKLHRQLFFPYELQTSIGSKILEITSCTSDCTDPSDDETDSSDSDTTSTSSSSASGVDGMKNRVLLKKRRKNKLPLRKRKSVAGGGGPPSSSSSSSSSSSNSSLSFKKSNTSWTTSSSSSDPSSSSDDEDDNKPLAAVVNREQNDANNFGNNNTNNIAENENGSELPAENNFLLRSFNHIYVSTEERRRQQQATQYRHNQIINNGYITLAGHDDEDTPSTSNALPLLPSDVYLNYYNNPHLNMYYRHNNSSGFTSSNLIPANTAIVEPAEPESAREVNLSAREVLLSPRAEQLTAVTTETVEESSTDAVEETKADMQESATVMERPTPMAEGSTTAAVEPTIDAAESKATTVEPTSKVIESTAESEQRPIVAMDAATAEEPTRVEEPTTSDEQSAAMMESSTVIISTAEPTTEVLQSISNYPVNPDSSIGSNNNNNSSVQLNENNEQDMIAQEEYRTGLRKVDEDVDDEDGNNCARMQQFKEWHEVLQLRSYNDELLTVLPYVVIE